MAAWPPLLVFVVAANANLQAVPPVAAPSLAGPLPSLAGLLLSYCFLLPFSSACSYAYDGRRKMRWHVSNRAYGEHWAAGDTIGCCLDLDAGTVSYLRNGRDLGVAFANVRRGMPGMAYFAGVSLSYAGGCVAAWVYDDGAVCWWRHAWQQRTELRLLQCCASHSQYHNLLLLSLPSAMFCILLLQSGVR